MIAYHFAGKQDLISEVVAEVLARAEEFMRPRVAGHSSGPEVLRAYIESNVAFMAEYRNHVLAILEIARGAGKAESGPSFDPAVLNAGAAALVKLLANYQRKGELRADFDPRVMAMTIRAAIDAVPRRLASEPKLDLEHVGRQLAELFDLATRHP